MSLLTTSEGYALWRSEVVGLARSEKFVPYIPAIALVGIYLATRHGDRPTSYDWRQSVLRSDEAIEGFRRSVESTHKDLVDITLEIPVSHLAEAYGASLQDQAKHSSVMDGLPASVPSIPYNEVFLAETIGLGHHDECIGLKPLKLYAQGQRVLDDHYPITAQHLKQLV